MTRPADPGGVPAGPPVCEAVWSSRDEVVGADLARFQEAGQAVASVCPGNPGVLGMRSSSGLVVTAAGAPLDALERKHLVAVVDVDPVKEVMLVSGPGEPSGWAAVLYLILRHREESAAAVCLQTGHASSDRSPQGEGDGEREGELEGKEEGQGEIGGTRRQGPADPGLGGRTTRGWGFEEGAPVADRLRGNPSKGLVDWTRWALQGLREGSVAFLPGGNHLAVGSDLSAAGERLRTGCAPG